MPIDALVVLCAQVTRDLLAIAKLVLLLSQHKPVTDGQTDTRRPA